MGGLLILKKELSKRIGLFHNYIQFQAKDVTPVQQEIYIILLCCNYMYKANSMLRIAESNAGC